MISDQDKPKRWRPRWSMRVLLIVVTLVCTYLACWMPTATRGVVGVKRQVDGLNGKAVAPLLVQVDVVFRPYPPLNAITSETRHYVWLFGPIIPLDLR